MPIIKTESGVEYEVLAEVDVLLVEQTPPSAASMTDQEKEFVQNRMKAMLMQQVEGWLCMVCGIDPDAPPPSRIIT
jgi:hypothetical protein